MLQKIRICSIEAIENNIPYCCAMRPDKYWTYFDSEIMYALPYDYIGIIEQHEDWYYHTVHNKELANQILGDGTLRLKFSHDDNACGKGIYTFPCNSGRVLDAWNDSFVIKFKSSKQHVHIVNITDNTNYHLGECIFFENLKLKNAIIMSIDDAILDAKKNYDNCIDVMPKYYGVIAEKPSLDNLPDFLMKNVIRKQSQWISEENMLSNYNTKTYENMLEVIDSYEINRTCNFSKTDLSFFRYYVEKALLESKD